MNRISLLLLCCGVVLLSGAVHGLWSNRWQSSAVLKEALLRVPEVPRTIGEWQSEDLETDTAAFAQAGAKAFWMRRYQHAKTGEVVTVILMCGRGGQMAVHTPDVCYKGAGYEMVGSPKKIKVPFPETVPAEFWTGSFAKEKSAGAGQLRLYWAWNATGDWQAPEVPRFTFRGQPALYKLYVSRQSTSGAENSATETALPFLQEFLPVVGKTLFPNSPP